MYEWWGVLLLIVQTLQNQQEWLLYFQIDPILKKIIFDTHNVLPMVPNYKSKNTIVLSWAKTKHILILFRIIKIISGYIFYYFLKSTTF